MFSSPSNTLSKQSTSGSQRPSAFPEVPRVPMVENENEKAKKTTSTTNKKRGYNEITGYDPADAAAEQSMPEKKMKTSGSPSKTLNLDKMNV